MAKAKKIKITLKRSPLGRKPNQRATVKALGLGRISSSVEKTADAAILGMVKCIDHLVEVEEI